MNAEPPLAGLGKRIGARLIDGLLVVPFYVLAIVASLVLDGIVGFLLLGLLYLGAIGFVIYNQVIRVGSGGQSFGKGWLGVRVVDQQTQEPIGAGRAFVREIVQSLLWSACLIPGIVNIFITAGNPQRRGWHDQAAGSWVWEAGAAPAPSGAAPVQTAPLAPPPAPPVAHPAPAAPAIGDGGDPEAASDATMKHSGAPVAPPATTPPPMTPGGMVAPPPGIASPPPGTPEEVGPAESDEPSSAQTRVVPRPSPAPAWTMRTAAGDSRALDGPVLLGRDPDGTLVDGAATWAVADPDLTMSKTHALVGLDDGEPWVEDWHSTNGVLLKRGTGETLLEPHAKTPLAAGDIIEFGEFPITLEIGP